jgi:4-amino-4-deoxy-L-arabinose transferase-like glycosyltransferase
MKEILLAWYRRCSLFVQTGSPEILFGFLGGLFFLTSLFFVAVSPLPWQSFLFPDKPNFSYPVFNQPDEAANYLFLQDAWKTGSFGVYEPLSNVTASQVHPRSVTVVASELVPIGFPGFISLLYWVSLPFFFLFGETFALILVVMIVPLLAASAPYLLYRVLNHACDESTARWSALLLFILPPWWYYASRSLQTPILFVWFLLMSLFLLFISSSTKYQKTVTALSGISLALAIFIRPSEVLWIGVVATVLLYRVRKYIDWSVFMYWVFGIIGVGVFFFLNQYFWYGNIFSTGYAMPQSSGVGGTIFQSPQGRFWFQGFFFPFGFHPITIITTMYQYSVQLFSVWAIGAVFGVIAVYKKWVSGEVHHMYQKIALGVSLFLLCSYGSWKFVDNVLGVASIGSSQARYFLPVYVLLLPFVVLGVRYIYTFFSSKKLVLLFALFSLLITSGAVVFGPPEGLYSIQKTLVGYVDWREQVLKRTPAQAVIVTRYADKYLVPFRKVIPGFQEEYEIDAVKALLLGNVPVFWFDVMLSDEEYQKTQERIAPKQLLLSSPLAQWGGLELRKIELKK